MMKGRCLADRYWILETIGAGGVTEASLAQDAEMGERVVLRLLAARFSDHREILRDACRESRQLAQPNIARVFDFYSGEGTPFVCREYVEGANIGEFSDRSTAATLDSFVQVAAALESAHGLGVVHGDLKNSKILQDVHGNVRVTDFCLAAALRTATLVSANGDHLSPQVRAGELPVAADDIYSLGALLAKMLSSANTPRELGELIQSISAEQRSARPTDLREIRQALAAYAKAGALDPDATLSTAPLARSSATISVSGDAPLLKQHSVTSSRNLLYAIAAGMLALAALVVFVVLPRWVEPQYPLPVSIEPAKPGGAEELSPEASVPPASKASAGAVLAELISLREQFEGWAIDRWAAADYAEAREVESRGDTAFVTGDFGIAHARYSEALTAYKALSGQRDAVLAETLENGATALEAYEQQRAIEAFDLALAIAPDNAPALDGVQRSKNLSTLLALMRSGESFEVDDALNAAQREYAQAVAIDPQSAPARDALARVEAAVVDEDFNTNLSLALVSLANKKLDTARAHFEKANALRPGSPEVAGGLRQLRQTQSSRAIATHHKLAQSAESAESWSEAASHYQSILETQEHLAFAEEGEQRNRELSRVTQRMAELLADPTQLFRPEALEEARELMAFGQSVAEGKVKLTEQLRHLEIAVQLASTPIPVVFESDAVTEVVIRGVGTLGNFARRDVPLKPGRYVVIGHRNGYRDMRREISVIPGRQQPVVEVRCIEKI